MEEARGPLPRLPVRQWVLSVPKRLRYFTCTLPVGSADSAHLRGVPAAVPEVRWTDAPDCLYHAQCRHPENSRPHRGGLRAPAYLPGTRTAAVGRLWCADG